MALGERTTISIEMAEYDVGKPISHHCAELRGAIKSRRSLKRYCLDAVAKERRYLALTNADNALNTSSTPKPIKTLPSSLPTR